MLQSLVSKIILVQPLGGKRGFFFFFFFHAGSTRRDQSFLVVNCQHADKKSAYATINLRPLHIMNPRSTRVVSGKVNECRWRSRRYQVNPLSRWRDVAGGVLRSSPKPEKRSIFCHVRGIENFVVCFLHTSGQIFFYQTPSRHPPHIPGLG